MSTRKRLIIAGCALLLLVAIVVFSVNANRGELPAVITQTVERQAELTAKVAAVGEIKPKEFVELQSEIAGVITALYVQEGDDVARGQVLLRIDPVQTEADVRMQEAMLTSSLADARNAEANITMQSSNLSRARAQLRAQEAAVDEALLQEELAELNYERRKQLFEDNLLAREEYERSRQERATARARVASAEAQRETTRTEITSINLSVEQAKNSRDSALSRVDQQKASLERSQDMLSKTTIRAPLAGVITQMNVEVGERAVPGTLNNPSATLMVIADLSVIEAEVEVDETDIVDLMLGQRATVTVDALPDAPLEGIVTEIGSSAIQKTNQSQEAKDFKVVIQLTEPPATLLPGLSCDADIVTAVRTDVVTVPIQALTIREVDPSEDADPDSSASGPDSSKSLHKQELEGVFGFKDGRVWFRPVTTGVVGATEVEILSGVDEDSIIVTGSYRVLRALEDGDSVRVERQDSRLKE